jgi:Zinc knuckle
MAEEKDKDFEKVLLLVFHGERVEFSMFWRQFLAYAATNGFDSALREDGTPELAIPANSRAAIPDNEIGDMQHQAMARNNKVMSAFTLAFKTQSLHGTISDAMTRDWPKGLASFVTMALIDEYSPSDTAAGVEAAAMLDKVKWKADESPTKLFEQLATIRNMFPEIVTEEQLITTMMAKAPKEYKTIITMESQSVRAQHAQEPTLKEYKKAMIEHFRTLGGVANADADGKEVTLAAVDPEDECHSCGKKGHHAKDCPKLKKGGGKWRKRNNNGGKNSKRTQNGGQCFTGKCDNCGKTGHKASQCWEKEENAHLRPRGYKPKGSGNEQANATVDRMEYLLASLEFPDTPKLMLDQASYDDPGHFPHQQCSVLHQQHRITGLLPQRLKTIGATPHIEKYWKRRFHWSQRDLDNLDRRAFTRVHFSLPKSDQ